MNTEQTADVTLKDVRKTAFEIIRELRDGKIDIETARTANCLIGSIIETAKTEVSFLNALPKQILSNMTFEEVKEIGVGFKDKDIELDKSLAEIEQRNRKPFTPGR